MQDPAHADPGDLDDVFGDLARDARGGATFVLSGKRESLRVTFGPKYLVGIVYSPKVPRAAEGAQSHPTAASESFVCIEPMASITDASNLEHRGEHVPLQSVAPGKVWEESFWIDPRNF